MCTCVPGWTPADLRGRAGLLEVLHPRRDPDVVAALRARLGLQRLARRRAAGSTVCPVPTCRSGGPPFRGLQRSGAFVGQFGAYVSRRAGGTRAALADAHDARRRRRARRAAQRPGHLAAPGAARRVHDAARLELDAQERRAARGRSARRGEAREAAARRRPDRRSRRPAPRPSRRPFPRPTIAFSHGCGNPTREPRGGFTVSSSTTAPATLITTCSAETTPPIGSLWIPTTSCVRRRRAPARAAREGERDDAQHEETAAPRSGRTASKPASSDIQAILASDPARSSRRRVPPCRGAIAGRHGAARRIRGRRPKPRAVDDCRGR